MAGVNKVIIVGNLGQDPEVRTMPTGEMVTTISVATSEKWQDKQAGEVKEVTEWHRIIFYKRKAEVAAEYLRKGSKVYVEGRLRTRKWQDQNGQDRYTTEIQGDVLQMLDSRADRQSGGYAPAAQPSYSSQAPSAPTAPRATPASKPAAEAPMDNFDDDIPF